MKYGFASVLFLFAAMGFAQESEEKETRAPGQLNQSKFKQLYEEFSTPNTLRRPTSRQMIWIFFGYSVIKM